MLGVYGFLNVPNFWNVETAYTIIAVIAVTCESDVNTVLIISPFNAARLSKSNEDIENFPLYKKLLKLIQYNIKYTYKNRKNEVLSLAFAQ